MVTPTKKNGRLPIDGELAELLAKRAAATAEILDAERRAAGAPVKDAKIYARRAALDAQIEAAERRAVEDHGRHAEAKYAERAGDWKALQRQRALLIVSLRSVNAEIEALRTSFRSGGAYPHLPLDGFTLRLFGTEKEPGLSGAMARAFLAESVKAKVISEKELKNA